MKKYWTIFKTEIASMAAFRAASVIWALFDIFLVGAFPFILLNILAHGGSLGTFNPRTIITYYVTAAFFSNFIWTHPETGLSRDIKDGKMSNFVVKPYNVLFATLLHELAWKWARFLVFLPMLILFLALAYRHLAIPSLAQLPYILAILPGAVFIYFLTAFLAGATAFWLEENSAALSIFWIANGLLGGFYLPLALFPRWLNQVTRFLPWRYAVHEPIQAVMQQFTAIDIIRVLFGQAMWIALLYCLYRAVWHFGLKKYSAVGK